jgi:transposase-like protein
MTRRRHSAKKAGWTEEWKQWLREDRDWLRVVVQEAVQQVLEAKMEEALQAEKGERRGQRLGYRSGYYGRTLVTRVGKLELRVPHDRQQRFRTEVFEYYQGRAA